MVNVECVSKFILRSISLHVPVGECVGIIGASGAGKTTLLKLLCGSIMPESGYIRILGKEPVKNRRHLGKAVSSFFAGRWALEDGDTVHQTFEMLQVVYGMEKESFWKEYEELSKRMDFAAYEDKTLKSLSLGQRMRVELSATLIGGPKLLLLDEPNVGLDENGKAVLWEILQEKCAQGTTVLVASHSLEELSALCSRLVLLDKGELMYYGSEQQLYGKYGAVGEVELVLEESFPDLQDLPVIEYVLEGNRLGLRYDMNHLTAAEILQVILAQTRVREVGVVRPALADIILKLKGERKDESD